MISKKQKKIIIYMLMLIYTYIFLTTNVFGKEKDFIKVEVPSAVVIDANTGRVLFEHNANEQRAMASLTKMMTSILLVENSKMDDIIEAPSAVNWLGGSVMGLKASDKVTMPHLLAGMLLPSGNDAAYTAAVHVAGDIDNFANMMTSKAKEIGAYNTSFKNPHGLDAEGHYSTAYDLALITRYALKHDIINKIMNSQTMDVKINNETKTLKNTNALLRTYEYADGGKTGFTNNAERCLICTATKNNMRLIAVVLGATTTEIRFNTAKNILEECFNKYSYRNLDKYLNFEIQIPIVKGEDEFYNVKINENFSYPLSEDEIKELYIKQDIIQSLEGGQTKGKYLGRVQLLLDNEELFFKDYILECDILKRSVKSFFKDIVNQFL